MKVFIVFMGLLLINVSLLSYEGDLGRYTRLQAYLKAAAEDCAAGAALYYDEERYSFGQFHIAREEAEKYLSKKTKSIEEKLNENMKGTLTYQSDFENKQVTVSLRYECEDLFSLGFLECKLLTRKAKYRWVE